MIRLKSLLFSIAIVVVAAPVFAQEKVSGVFAQEKVSGIDQSLFSKDVSPGDNFYIYSNQVWLEKTEIPSDKSNYGIFTVLNDNTQEQVKTLIEAAAASKSDQGSAAQKVGDLYSSVLNVDQRNAAGIDPIKPLLALVADLKNRRQVAKAMGKLVPHGVYGPLAPYISVDAKDSDNYTVYVTQSGLTLPDRDYYLESDQRYVDLRAKLVDYIEEMLSAIGYADAKAAAQNVFEIEKQIAKSQWTKTKNRDPEKTYNKMSSEEMDKLCGALRWTNVAEGANLALIDQVVARQPTYFSDLGDMFKNIPASHWQEYLNFRVIDGYASGLSEELERKHFAFHKTAVRGVEEQEPLWKRGVNTAGGVVGELVGQLYVESHFQTRG